MKKQVTLILSLGIMLLMSIFVIIVFNFRSSNAISTNENDPENKAETSPSPNSASQVLSNCGEQIAYSAENFTDVSICTEYKNGECSNNLITCYIDITNLDSSTTGLFEINFDFFDESNKIIFSDSEEASLATKGKKTFQASYNAKAENAEKKITCSYKTIKIPKHEC